MGNASRCRILIPESLVKLGFMESFSWYDAGVQEYFADPLTLFVAQMALMGWVEGRRWADLVRPGSIDMEPKFPNRENLKPDVGYPGGLWFDPMQWGRGSPQPVLVLRTKEIKNGRLAMLAFMGFGFRLFILETLGTAINFRHSHLIDCLEEKLLNQKKQGAEKIAQRNLPSHGEKTLIATMHSHLIDFLEEKVLIQKTKE